jgi:hypothetical protein
MLALNMGGLKDFGQRAKNGCVAWLQNGERAEFCFFLVPKIKNRVLKL